MNEEKLVKKLIENTGDIVLCELLIQMKRCRYPFEIFDSNPPEEFTNAERNLREALDEHYPDAIDWSQVYPHARANIETQVVPKEIKELYMRLQVKLEKYI